MKRFSIGFCLAAFATAGVACICVYEPGSWAALAEETSVVFWNSKTKREDFIRVMKFDSKAKSFGFLFTTPSIPDLGEVDPKIFDTLYEAVEQERNRLRGSNTTESTAAAATGEVEVIKVEKVAGMVATVLRTSDAAALPAWLKANGYSYDGNVVAWAEPYVAKKWPITAFKIDTSIKNPSAEPKALRLTFQSPKLFYPYNGYQPAKDMPRVPDRSLNLYMLSDMPLEGEREDQPKQSWLRGGGRTPFEMTASATLLATIAKQANIPVSVTQNLTHFTNVTESVSAVTRTADLYFTPKPKSKAWMVAAFGGSATAIIVALIASRRLRPNA